MLSQLAMSLGDQSIELEPGDTATIGRADDNRLITDDPRVSRAQLRVSQSVDQWLVESVGRAGTFLGAERVVSFFVTHDVSLRLGSLDGPELRIELIHESEPEPERNGETILTWPSTPSASSTRNEETGAPIAAMTLAPPATPSPRPEEAPPAAEPVVADAIGENPLSEKSRSDTKTRARFNTRKTSTGATLVVLILVYLVVAGASHLWPFQTSGQSQASVRQSAQTLLRLLPHDAENCGRVPASDGLGSVLAVTCASPSLTGSVYGYLYENENDEKAGFAAFNHRSGVDVSKLGNACPPANGSGGTIPWRNNGQRTEPDQKLECYTGGSDPRSTSGRFPPTMPSSWRSGRRANRFKRSRRGGSTMPEVILLTPGRESASQIRALLSVVRRENVRVRRRDTVPVLTQARRSRRNLPTGRWDVGGTPNGIGVGLLGPLEVHGLDRDLKVSPKERALLIALALRPNKVVGVSELIDILWDEDPPVTAHKTLQTYVSGLRRQLPPEVLLTVPNGYRLGIESDMVDAYRFESMLRVAEAKEMKEDDAVGRLTSSMKAWRLEGASHARFPRVASDRFRRAALRGAPQGSGRVPGRLWLMAGLHQDYVAEFELAVSEEPFRGTRGLS